VDGALLQMQHAAQAEERKRERQQREALLLNAPGLRQQ
jgi:hypothetical protein